MEKQNINSNYEQSTNNKIYTKKEINNIQNEWEPFINQINNKCNLSTKERILNVINITFEGFPVANINFQNRINNILSDSNELLSMILKDIMEFHEYRILILSIMDDLQKTIPPTIIKSLPTVMDALNQKTSSILSFLNYNNNNNNNLVTIDPEPNELYKNIIERYQSCSSTIDMKELFINLNNLKEDKAIKNETINGGKLNYKKGGLNDYYVNKTIDVVGNIDTQKVIDIINKRQDLIKDWNTLINSNKSKEYRYRAAKRLIIQTLISVIGLTCNISTNLFGWTIAPMIICPIISLGTSIFSNFIDKERVSNSFSDTDFILKIEDNLLLFNIARNRLLGYLYNEDNEKTSPNILLQNKNGKNRTWKEFIYDIFTGNMTSHEAYNMCYLTIFLDSCKNINIEELYSSYKLLYHDIKDIINNTLFNNNLIYNKEKKNKLEYYLSLCEKNIEELSVLIKNNRFISIEPNEVDILINSIIKNLIVKNKNNKKYLKDLSKENITSALKCIFNYIISNKVIEFPLKDRTIINKKNNEKYFNISYNSKFFTLRKCQYTGNLYKIQQNKDKLNDLLNNLKPSEISLHSLITSIITVLDNTKEIFYNADNYKMSDESSVSNISYVPSVSNVSNISNVPNGSNRSINSNVSNKSNRPIKSNGSSKPIRYNGWISN